MTLTRIRRVALVNDRADNGDDHKYHYDQANQAQHANDSEPGQTPDDG